VELAYDLAGYNRKFTLSDTDVIQFVGQYTSVTTADFALLTQNNSGDIVLGITAQELNSGSTPSTVALQAAMVAYANTQLTSNGA